MAHASVAFQLRISRGTWLEQRPPHLSGKSPNLFPIFVAQMIVSKGVRGLELLINSELAGKTDFYSRTPKIVEKDRGLIDGTAQLDEGRKALVGKATQ